MARCTHTSPAARPEYAVPRHIVPEAFRDFAFAELTTAPLHWPGICFNPDCARDFTLARDWQMYCCMACERAGTAELRAWGHRMALALLTWRMGKYEARDKAVRARTAAARRYLSQVQSAWLADRQARIARARQQGGGA